MFALLLMTTVTKAQEIKDVFLNMPSSIVYGLNSELNQILLDSPTDSVKSVASPIYKKVERQILTSSLISLKTSPVGTTDIKLLPLVNNSKIVCVVKSVCKDFCDSKISFYTDKWEPIDGTELFPKVEIDWFIKEDVDKSSEEYMTAIGGLDMISVKYVLSPDENLVSLQFDPKGFMTKEDYKKIEPLLTKEPKVLKWDKVRFK